MVATLWPRNKCPILSLFSTLLNTETCNTVITERWPVAPQAAPEADLSITQDWGILSFSYNNSSSQRLVSSFQGPGLELGALLGHPISSPQSPCEQVALYPFHR